MPFLIALADTRTYRTSPLIRALTPLQVGQKTAQLGRRRHVRADAALFLGLAAAPNMMALNRSHAGQFTMSSHK